MSETEHASVATPTTTGIAGSGTSGAAADCASAAPGRLAAASTPTTAAIRARLAKVYDPELRRPLTELGMIGEVQLTDEGLARVGVILTVSGCPAAAHIESEVRQAAASVPGVAEVEVAARVMSPTERSALVALLQGSRPAREIPFGPDTLTRVIAVGSGKGGVGKSTITANLAVALAARGLSVGLVDADVHGFSVPGLLGLVHDGVVARPTRIDSMIVPPIAFGVKTISIGMFLDPERGESLSSPVAWRGPMLHRTIKQFLNDVYFGDLDVLLLDLPPGTGDVAISVAQLLPTAEALVVTTPQEAASSVAVRSGVLAHRSGQRIIGVVENMSAIQGSDGSMLDLFGSGGGTLVARELSRLTGIEVPLLASVPLSAALRQDGDAGTPVTLHHPRDRAAQALDTLAAHLAPTPRGSRLLPLSLL